MLRARKGILRTRNKKAYAFTLTPLGRRRGRLAADGEEDIGQLTPVPESNRRLRGKTATPSPSGVKVNAYAFCSVVRRIPLRARSILTPSGERPEASVRGFSVLEGAEHAVIGDEGYAALDLSIVSAPCFIRSPILAFHQANATLDPSLVNGLLLRTSVRETRPPRLLTN